MNTFELIEKLEMIAPEKRAAKWDNPGLLVGDNKEIKKIVIAVDASDYVINTAIEQKADMIITHHPLIFSGLKNVSVKDFIGRRIYKLASHGIALYAMHTNFDVCQMTEAAGNKLGIKKQGIIEITDTVSNADGSVIEDIGYGMFGTINAETVLDLAKLVKKKFSLNNIRVFGDLSRKVQKAGIFPGSGKSSIDEAVNHSIDVLVTGDIDHHSGIDAVAKGLCVIDAGHYGIEKIFVECMEEYLSNEISEIDLVAIADDEPFVTL